VLGELEGNQGGVGALMARCLNCSQPFGLGQRMFRTGPMAGWCLRCYNQKKQAERRQQITRRPKPKISLEQQRRALNTAFKNRY